MALTAASLIAGVLDSGAAVPVTGGLGITVLTLVGLLLRELNKSSGGAWRVVREKNRTIHEQTWQVRSLRYQLAKCQGVDPGPDPGVYVPPSEEELKTW